MGYTIAADGKSITCHQCGLTSYGLNDVRHRYCVRCDVFHDCGDAGLPDAAPIAGDGE